jgi:hypothetical protein
MTSILGRFAAVVLATLTVCWPANSVEGSTSTVVPIQFTWDLQ